MERFNSLGSFLKNKFGCKVYKVSLDLGSTCPNRDGTKGTGGCIYCNPESNLPLIAGGRPVKEQLEKGIAYMKKRHRGSSKFISYFQHYSNTYGRTAELVKAYNDSISHPEVVGLAVSTRPDCISDEMWTALDGFNKRTFFWLELGLQSANDATLDAINRGHTVRDFEEASKKASALGIPVCAHIILGLPGETREDALRTVDLLVNLGVWGIKIHNLHILKNTRLAELFKEGKIELLGLKEYASLVVDCLERIPDNVIIHRFNSHSPKGLTIAPPWSVNKLATVNEVKKELQRRNSRQGRLVRGISPGRLSRTSCSLSCS